jgi:hypothetical protein
VHVRVYVCVYVCDDGVAAVRVCGLCVCEWVRGGGGGGCGGGGGGWRWL